MEELFFMHLMNDCVEVLHKYHTSKPSHNGVVLSQLTLSPWLEPPEHPSISNWADLKAETCASSHKTIGFCRLMCCPEVLQQSWLERHH
jgi:hypothetical protein